MAQTAALKDIGGLYVWTATLRDAASFATFAPAVLESLFKWVEPPSGTSNRRLFSPRVWATCIWIKHAERGRSCAAVIELKKKKKKKKRGKGPKIKTPSVKQLPKGPLAERSNRSRLSSMSHANKLTQRCIQREPFAADQVTQSERSRTSGPLNVSLCQSIKGAVHDTTLRCVSTAVFSKLFFFF